MTNSHGKCAICGKHDYLQPLHDNNGGPLCCILCAGNWHGKHGRRRRLGRIVIRAMAAYMNGGGSWTDIDKLKMTAMGLGLTSKGLDKVFDPLAYMADTAKTDGETIELTSELLADAIKIAHPDLHPPDRRELAHRVTQGLIALRPFTFPAEKPKPVAPSKPSGPMATRTKPPAPSSGTEPKRYPCKECAADVPYYYSAECRTEFESRQQKERDQESAKRRKWYAERKLSREHRKPPTICATCGAGFKGKRRDARFCSANCRQRAHRGVTDKTKSNSERINMCDRVDRDHRVVTAK
jgi:hypothetical protein